MGAGLAEGLSRLTSRPQPHIIAIVSPASAAQFRASANVANEPIHCVRSAFRVE